jgi:hypothetical protein
VVVVVVVVVMLAQQMVWAELVVAETQAQQWGVLAQ